MSRVKRGAPYVVVLAILGLLVAHVPFFASSEAQAPPPAYRALYDTYISPSIDKVYQTGQASLSGWSASAPSREAAWAATCDRCLVNSTICNKFGSHNVDLSRSFDGTGGRVQRVLKRAMAGEPIKIGAMGGSISLGHGCNCHPWHAQVGEWWNATFPNEGNSFRVGAVGGRGSNYFQYCHHVDEDVDLILVEMSVNDIYLNLEAQHTFETLLRALLSYPKHPAVIYLRTFQTQQELGTGGELHVSTLQYYDVPVIGVRDWMLPKIMADWSASEQWFVWSEGKDKLHPLGQAHTAMAEMIQLYLEQQLCYINNDRPYIPPSNHPLVPQENQFASLDALPRVRLNQRLTENNTTPDIISTCASVDSKEHPLTPVAAATHGWEFWLQPPQMEKRYWRSTEVGSVITFDMELTVGNINLYYLRSPKMDLGNIQCWMDDDKTRTETVEGYWRRETSVGQQQEFTFGLKHRPTGKHQLHCENVGNPANATMSTFLIIGLFTV